MSAQTSQPNPADFRHFLRSKLYFWGLFAGALGLLLLFLWALRASLETILVVIFFFVGFAAIVFLIDYLERRSFYRKLLQNVTQLDQAYLVLETLTRPRFYDGAILYDALYAINKSMVEVVQKYELESRDFREYIELWVHEVKTPLAALSLMTHDRRITAQINRLDGLVEQVLYLVRAENAEHDYLIRPITLAKVVSSVALKNQDALLAAKINLRADGLDYQVDTDNKWLEFILDQIFQNSIKYQAQNIAVTATQTAAKTTLTIADDGIGISAKDLPRVFEKSFTGENGHQRAASGKPTGMGLYIVKTLCDKLEVGIEVTSPRHRGTVVCLTFPRHDFYETVRAETR